LQNDAKEREIIELRDRNSNLAQREAELRNKLDQEYRENSLLSRELEEKDIKYDEYRFSLKKKHEVEMHKLIHLYHKRAEMEKSKQSPSNQSSQSSYLHSRRNLRTATLINTKLKHHGDQRS
jgi:predicted nuclease with TOPRIM domain